MREIFSTPDNPGPIKASEVRAADAVFHAKQVVNAEIAAALFVLVLLVVFGLPRLWRRVRTLLAVPVTMPDPVSRRD